MYAYPRAELENRVAGRYLPAELSTEQAVSLVADRTQRPAALVRHLVPRHGRRVFIAGRRGGWIIEAP